MQDGWTPTRSDTTNRIDAGGQSPTRHPSKKATPSLTAVKLYFGVQNIQHHSKATPSPAGSGCAFGPSGGQHSHAGWVDTDNDPTPPTASMQVDTHQGQHQQEGHPTPQQDHPITRWFRVCLWPIWWTAQPCRMGGHRQRSDTTNGIHAGGHPPRTAPARRPSNTTARPPHHPLVQGVAIASSGGQQRHARWVDTDSDPTPPRTALPPSE